MTTKSPLTEGRMKTNMGKKEQSDKIGPNVPPPSISLKIQIKEILKENLSFEVKTTNTYTGGLDDSGSLYRDSSTLVVYFDDEKITEVDL